MVINRSVDYAVAGIIHLATLPPGAVEPVEEIARNRALPGHAFAAVVRRLARAGLVFTQRGTGGGVSLARDPSEISMRDVVEAVEGPIRLAREAGNNGTADYTRPVWERVERAILAELEAANLAEMARAASPNRVATHP
jgi:Rrf2 family protein